MAYSYTRLEELDNDYTLWRVTRPGRHCLYIVAEWNEHHRNWLIPLRAKRPTDGVTRWRVTAGSSCHRNLAVAYETAPGNPWTFRTKHEARYFAECGEPELPY